MNEINQKVNLNCPVEVNKEKEISKKQKIENIKIEGSDDFQLSKSNEDCSNESMDNLIANATAENQKLNEQKSDPNESEEFSKNRRSNEILSTTKNHLNSLEKRIFTHSDLHDFLHCQPFEDLSLFILQLGNSVEGIEDVKCINQRLAFIVEIFEIVESLVGLNMDSSAKSR